MKIAANISQYGFLACLMMLTGCSDGSFTSFETEQVQENLNAGPQPLAIVSVAPTRQWMSDFDRLFPAGSMAWS